MARVKMPGFDELPDGDQRNLTQELQDLHSASGYLSMSKISDEIEALPDDGATLSRSSVYNILGGQRTSRDNVCFIARVLAAHAHPPQSPDDAAGRVVSLWNLAEARPDADLGVLEEIDEVLETDPASFIRGFVHREGPSWEAAQVAERLKRNFPLLPETIWRLVPRGVAVGKPVGRMLILLTAAYLTGQAETFSSTAKRSTTGWKWTDSETGRALNAACSLWTEGQAALRDGFVTDFCSWHAANLGVEYPPQLDLRLHELVDTTYLEAHFGTGDEDAFEVLWNEGVQLGGGRRRNSPTVQHAVDFMEPAIRQAVHDGRYEEALNSLTDLWSFDPDRGSELRMELGFLSLPESERAIIAALWSRIALHNRFSFARADTPKRAMNTVRGPGNSASNIVRSISAQSSEQRAQAVVASRARDHVPTRRKWSADLLAQFAEQLFYTTEDALTSLIVAIRSGGKLERLHGFHFLAREHGSVHSSKVVYQYCDAPVTFRAIAPEVLSTERDAMSGQLDISGLTIVSLKSPIASDLQGFVKDWDPAGHRRISLHAVDATGFLGPTPGVVRYDPPPSPPGPWQRYTTDPASLCYSGEDPVQLESTYQVMVPVTAVDSLGSQVTGTLEEDTLDWLSDGGNTIRVILGDFGDGKSFFTYALARRMCQAAVSAGSRDKVCVPLRLALRELRLAGNGQNLLRRRLELFGSSVADWRALCERYQTLVILDGFDEMSKGIARADVRRNIDLLRECCQVFTGSKIMITSRGHVARGDHDEVVAFERLGEVEIRRINPLGRDQVWQSLKRSALDPAQARAVGRLQRLNDPIGLATKPLYHGMIREVLADLPEDGFDEHVLYELYIQKSLNRKLELLEHDEAEATLKQLKGNLLKILEDLAMDLHRTNAAYVCLKDFDRASGGHGFAIMLWDLHEVGDRDEDDATARVGIRSLLRSVEEAEVDPEHWPVDFFHRSMREYCVARGLVRLLESEPGRARSMLAEGILAPAVLRFAALILKSGEHETAIRELKKLAHSVRRADEEPSPLGGNAVSVLFAALGQLPGSDWSGLWLDDAMLAGADLTEVDLSGSSLCRANLDNANLTGADLSNADLTGVRLDETEPVTALSTAGTECVYAAYGDCTIREWRFGTGVTVNQVVATVPHIVEELWLTSPQRLIAVGGSQLTVLSEENGTWSELARFAVKSTYRPVTYADGAAALIEDQADAAGCRLHWWPLAHEQVFVRAIATPTAWSVLGREASAVALDGNIVVELGTADGHGSVLASIPTTRIGVTALSLRRLPGAQLHLAVGRNDGTVGLYRVDVQGDAGVGVPLWEQSLHAGPVEAVAFLGDERLVTGGMDRSLRVVPIDGGAAPEDIPRLELTLRCMDVKLDGVLGASEQDRLRVLAAKQ